MTTTVDTPTAQLLVRLEEARAVTDQLFQIVRRDSFYERPIAERHRIVFYVGHLEAFDANLLAGRLPDFAPVNPQFDRLFAFGIDPVGGGLPDDQPADWPDLSSVRRYVELTRDVLNTAIANADGQADPVLMNVAIEHRLMHAETLAYMLHRLPVKSTLWRALDDSGKEPAGQSSSEMMEIPAGLATLGMARGSREFGWDNEFVIHSQPVDAFAIDRYMVSNGDFLKFIDAGGYQSHELWTPQDWEWITTQGVSYPAFWRRQRDGWQIRGMFQEIPLQGDWPVYVSHAEAAAYAKWVGKKLPTEAQWHRAAYGTPEGGERAYPWGDAEPDSERGNFDFVRWDPVSVTRFPEGQSAFGVAGMLGNGWEWTSTPFHPFSGFEAHPFYPGYSANFFDGRHYVMKGGSSRTAAALLRRSFRNWFQPHYPYIYSGFRCVTQ